MQFNNGRLTGVAEQNLSNVPPGMVRVQYLDGDGNNFAVYVDVPAGTDAAGFLRLAKPAASTGHYKARVNNLNPLPGCALASGDDVVVTPTKIVAG